MSAPCQEEEQLLCGLVCKGRIATGPDHGAPVIEARFDMPPVSSQISVAALIALVSVHLMCDYYIHVSGDWLTLSKDNGESLPSSIVVTLRDCNIRSGDTLTLHVDVAQWLLWG